MATIGDLLINLNITGGQAASNIIKNLGSNMQNFGRTLTNNISKPIIGFFTEGIMLASSMNESMNRVNTIFGKSGQDIIKWSGTLIEKFGLSKAQALDYVGAMGAMLQSSGLSSKASIDMSKSLVQLTGDMASFYDMDHEDIWIKLRAGIMGETEPLKALGINMSVANMEAHALTMGIKKNWNEMTQGEQVAIRYDYIMNKTKNAQGDFAKTQDGFANKLRTTKIAFSEIQAVLGNVLLPYVEKGLRLFYNLTTQLLELLPSIDQNVVIFGLLAAAIGPLTAIAGGLVVAFGAVIGAATTIITTIGAIGLPVTIAIAAITAAIAAIIAITTGWVASNKEAQQGIVNAFNNIVSKVQIAIQYLIENFDNIKNSIMGFVNTIIEIATPAIDELIAAFQGFDIDTIVESFKQLWVTLGPVLEILGLLAAIIIGTVIGAITGIVNALDNFIALIINAVGVITSAIGLIWNILTLNFEGIGKSWNDLLDNMIGVIGNAIQVIIDLVGGFINGFIAFFQGLYDTLVGGSIIPDMVNAIIQWFNNLVSFVTGIVQGFVNIVVNLFNAMKNQATNVFNAMKAVISLVVNAIKSVITSGFNAAKTVITTVINVIKSVITSGFNAARSIISSAINTIRSVITSGFNAARSIISSVINTIRSVITSGFNAARSSISSAINTIRSVVTSGFNSVRSSISSAINTAKSLISSGFNTMKSIVNSAINTIRSTVSKLGGIFRSALSTAVSAIRSVASSMFSAGANLVGNLINGVTSKISQFKAKIGELANAAKKLIGFESPTEEGPGKTAHKWMPNLIDMMVKGLNNGVSKVASASSNVAQALQFNTSGAMRTALNSNKTNNVIGSPSNVTFNIDATHMDVDQLGRMLVSKFRSYGIRSQTE